VLHELAVGGMDVKSGINVSLRYKSVEIDCSYKLDLLVNDTVIVELKSVDQIVWIHKAQLLTYLRLTGRPVDLLINFNVPVLKDGVSRLLNTRPAEVTENAGRQQHGDTK
jgi:GxxExxY protein